MMRSKSGARSRVLAWLPTSSKSGVGAWRTFQKSSELRAGLVAQRKKRRRMRSQRVPNRRSASHRARFAQRCGSLNARVPQMGWKLALARRGAHR
ncbi:MAG: hypothetical protein JNJ88_05935 [Planctomycetes bacterium]|nr:hypothetical protein [Planctomycetota bacterium]